MSNTIKHQAVIGTITAKVDRSIGYRVSTSELTSEQKALFMELINLPVNVIIQPIDEPQAPVIKINTDLEQRTPSQRLRNVIYILWTQRGKKGEFEAFYNASMERIIEMAKSKIESSE